MHEMGHADSPTLTIQLSTLPTSRVAQLEAPEEIIKSDIYLSLFLTEKRALYAILHNLMKAQISTHTQTHSTTSTMMTTMVTSTTTAPMLHFGDSAGGGVRFRNKQHKKQIRIRFLSLFRVLLDVESGFHFMLGLEFFRSFRKLSHKCRTESGEA